VEEEGVDARREEREIVPGRAGRGEGRFAKEGGNYSINLVKMRRRARSSREKDPPSNGKGGGEDGFFECIQIGGGGGMLKNTGGITRRITVRNFVIGAEGQKGTLEQKKADPSSSPGEKDAFRTGDSKGRVG